MRKWEGFGWLAGVLTSVNSDGRRTIDKEKVNFFGATTWTRRRRSPSLTCSSSRQYDTTEDAEYDSWLLLEKVEPEGEAGGEDGAQQEAGARGASRRPGRRQCSFPRQ